MGWTSNFDLNRERSKAVLSPIWSKGINWLTLRGGVSFDIVQEP
jgi:hypothetical protein